MPKLYDISDWSEQPWWNTGGTRNKKVYQNPEDGEIYYFKESFNKGKRNYKYEFWSEIVASEVGLSLGFDLLPYQIAIRGNVIGCLSRSMIDPSSEELIEGGKYLQVIDSSFDPSDPKLRSKYSFQLIQESICSLVKAEFVFNIVDTVLFDAFIGNSDRHQENWALINIHSNVTKSLSQIERAYRDGYMPKLLKWVLQKMYYSTGKLKPEFEHARLSLLKETRFAPIYDSGCSFGRELEDKRVEKLLDYQSEVIKYLDKGLAEIHWEGRKMSHFDLLEKILSEKDFQLTLLESMERVLKKFDEQKLTKLIRDIDYPLKEAGLPFSLPNNRKELMIKLLTSRKDRIEEIYGRYRK